MSIQYDVRPYVEIIDKTYNTIKIHVSHPDENSDDLDYIKVSLSTGEGFNTSKRDITITSDKIAGTNVSITVKYTYLGIDTLESTIHTSIPVQPAPRDERLYAPSEADRRISVPNTSLVIDPITMMYLDNDGKYDCIIQLTDSNIDDIKLLVTDEQFGNIKNRLQQDPYDSNYKIDMFTGFRTDPIGNIIGVLPDDYDREGKILELQKAYLNQFLVEHIEPDTDKNDPSPESLMRTYVLSKNFYTGNARNMTIFEKEVMKYVECKQLNIDVLMDLYKEFPSWSTVDKYYKLPILVLMLKDYIASMRTEV